MENVKNSLDLLIDGVISSVDKFVPYYYYITKEEMNNIRFNVIQYMTKANMEVWHDKGLVIIY